MKRFLLGIVFLVSAIVVWAQGTISGKLVDKDTNEPLIGATVLIKGTSKGTITNLDGGFTLAAKEGNTLVISYVGYVTQEVVLSGSGDLGDIAVQSDAIGLDGIEVIASVAEERKTPVAVSSISAIEIQEKASNAEFPELLKSTPGVYTSRAGGGYGDSRIAVRGFNDVNVAVMINGVPVNDMENGRVYWSNWAGLTDVTRTMQVQRGLGASKVAVPSIGGTINIVTRNTDAVQGGSFFYGIGND
ncbi:MAG: carboxypeptidase-like regulatory domain-containing protein, partial [Cyclobacteriaceae bacterium]